MAMRNLFLLLCSAILPVSLNAATLLGRQSPFGDRIESFTAKQVAMGGAKLAVTEDSSALFFNPAGLSALRQAGSGGARGRVQLIFTPSLFSTYEKHAHSDATK